MTKWLADTWVCCRAGGTYSGCLGGDEVSVPHDAGGTILTIDGKAVSG